MSAFAKAAVCTDPGHWSVRVRRPSVTGVVGIFNRANLTTASRGLISIKDRDGLGELTCECYAIVRAATPN